MLVMIVVNISLATNGYSQEKKTILPSEYPVDWGVLFVPAKPLPSGYQFGRMTTVLPAGSTTYAGSMPLPTDIIWDRDVPITLRDGTVIYTDIFRPASSPTNLPAIIAWSPYGKTLPSSKVTGAPAVPPNWGSGWAKGEGPDPAFWCNHGYAVLNPDARGAYMSGGNVQFLGMVDAADGYDVVEWVARQDWSNGKVTFFGSSWLAMAQWNIAATEPPHLTAIAPWNGISDFYRNAYVQGGIPDTAFQNMIAGNDKGLNLREDIAGMLQKEPLMSPYWDDKAVKLENITVPAYVGCDVTTTLHRMGSFEGFRRISSKEKWLRVDNTMEWYDEYNPVNEEDLLRFFDHYLKGLDNGWEQTPRVRIAVLDPAAGGEEFDRVNVPFLDMPIPETEYRKFYLDAATATLSRHPTTAISSVSYDAQTGQTTFTIRFDEDTQMIGYPKLRLWVEADGANDMDVFALFEKLDAAGNLLDPDPYIRSWYDPSPPGTPGRLRVSLRQLDPKLSTHFLPVYSFRQNNYLSPGEIVPVDIALLPVSELWHAGEQLRLIVAGQIIDVKPDYKSSWFVSVPTINTGTHIIHTGLQYDSYLQLPIVPIREKSH